jgi:hypothetical protein
MRQIREFRRYAGLMTKMELEESIAKLTEKLQASNGKK